MADRDLFRNLSKVLLSLKEFLGVEEAVAYFIRLRWCGERFILQISRAVPGGLRTHDTQLWNAVGYLKIFPSLVILQRGIRKGHQGSGMSSS